MCMEQRGGTITERDGFLTDAVNPTQRMVRIIVPLEDTCEFVQGRASSLTRQSSFRRVVPLTSYNLNAEEVLYNGI